MRAVTEQRKRVWMLQTGEPLPFQGESSRPMRAISLAQKLVDSGHDVTLWSADFDHYRHSHRFNRNTKIKVSDQLEVRLIKSRGYNRNLGPGRLVDHAQLALQLSRLLRHEDPPDVAFVGFPPIEAAFVMTRWLRSAGVPMLVDVKDAWPEIFQRAFPERAAPIGKVALSGYSFLARQCFRDATGLTSITEEFLEWALDTCARPRREADGVFPLTAARPTFSDTEMAIAQDWWDSRGVLDDGTFRICFVGSLPSSYDFGPVAQAASLTGVQFVICGDGSQADNVRELMSPHPNVTMPGWVTSAQAEALARRSTVSLAPIAPHPDFMMSLPNKYFDSISKGLPVIAGITGALGRELASRGVGMSYGLDAGISLRECLAQLQSRSDLVEEMSRNATQLYDREYRHDLVYQRMADHLVGLASDSEPVS